MAMAARRGNGSATPRVHADDAEVQARHRETPITESARPPRECKTMRVLIAPDKFKGSLTAAEVADHLAKGLAEAGANSRTLPLADGGDGSVAAALASGFHPLPVDVHGATGEDHRGDRRVRRGHRDRRSRQHLRTRPPSPVETGHR